MGKEQHSVAGDVKISINASQAEDGSLTVTEAARRLRWNILLPEALSRGASPSEGSS